MEGLHISRDLKAVPYLKSGIFLKETKKNTEEKGRKEEKKKKPFFKKSQS